MKRIGLLLFILSTSCYRMPTKGEVSVIPNTNNPALIHQEQTPWTPAVEM